MKSIDIFNWHEVKGNEGQGQGRLWLRASCHGALYIEAEGYEICAGFGAEFDLAVAQEFRYRFEPSAKGGKAFRYEVVPIIAESSGEIFSNADMQSLASGHTAEIRALLRKQEIINMQALQQSRAELAAAKRLRDQVPQPAEQQALDEREEQEADDQSADNEGEGA